MSIKQAIKVVQYHWGEQNRSYPMTREINAAYCRRHEYEYVVKTFPPRDDRACRWSKIPAMREELHDCDFLLYLDADAFFYSHELRIEEELLPLIGGKQIMMSAVEKESGNGRQESEVRSKNNLLPSSLPNTGVVLVRNTRRAAEVLRVWDESSERPGLENLRFHSPCEQEACLRTIRQEYAGDVELLKDYYLMNGTNGLFIRHLMGMSDNQRFQVLKKFMDNRQGIILGCDVRNTRAIQSPKKTWQWGIGMLTTTHRTGGMLARTLESFRGTGFDPPVVFTDLERKGGLWNLHRALKTLLKQYPNADAYVVIEDDVLFSKNIREYLELELWPSVSEHGCICSIFTPTMYSSDKSWHVEDRGDKTWMSQCRIYHPLSAKKLVADLENDGRLRNSWRQNDAAVGEWAKNNNVDIWFHCPSLTQHMSPKNTSYEANRSLDYRIGYARDFIGEHRSIHEYRAEFGTAPRKVRFLSQLEIFAGKDRLSKDTKYLFTPEMAHHLADKLNQYNCDVGELSFVGEGISAWQHAEQCVQLLRLTGKIQNTTMTTSLTEKIDLKPSELLFDAICIEDDGTKPHLIEHYVGNPCYTILAQDRESKNCSPTPRLLGKEVFLCSIVGYHTLKSCSTGSVPEKLKAHRWTLDQFFQNLDEILSGFEAQETCKSCPRLSEEPANFQTV